MAQKVYVATSWRNTQQPQIVRDLQAMGYEVYDFRNPSGNAGFAWSQIPLHGKENHDCISAHSYLEVLDHPRAQDGFESDFNAMQAADIVVMVLPCERDAHLELGWAVGAGKQTHIVLDDPCKASLMYRMVDFIHPTVGGLYNVLGVNK